jgi:hypothetical protein
MTLDGVVRNGMVVLEQGARLPEGTRVKVLAEPTEVETQPALLSLLKLSGIVKDLPEDFAAQHDHYIHGTPKR